MMEIIMRQVKSDACAQCVQLTQTSAVPSGGGERMGVRGRLEQKSLFVEFKYCSLGTDNLFIISFFVSFSLDFRLF